MDEGPTQITIERVRDPDRIKRYALVPRASQNGSKPEGERVRRYNLARIGVSPRSALGQDRHERLEQVADAERHPTEDT